MLDWGCLDGWVLVITFRERGLGCVLHVWVSGGGLHTIEAADRGAMLSASKYWACRMFCSMEVTSFSFISVDISGARPVSCVVSFILWCI